MDVFGRLSDYDVFAYLPQGFFVLAAADFFFGTSFVIHANWDVSTGVFVLFLSYAAGHLVAGPASRLLEAGIVHDMLKPPSVHLLLAEPSASQLSQFLLPSYFSPLSRTMRARVQTALEKAGSDLRGDEAYWVAYSVAKRDEHAKPRLANFLNVYGFCRNLSFIAAVTAELLFVQAWVAPRLDTFGSAAHEFAAAVGFALISFQLFKRYLKFYRLYSIEVFVTFATSQAGEK
ncbi:hypothetical protein [Mesorhizobium sp. M1D.F.Ca.ET.043.01.1.1]|uniref:hypothetical protein n=1 Tax=Mesorhizobium sp. M1D.F.Ca.ET.043.01.1.1 TaxID=2493669 RepID=UPI000F75714E|nr:hypothetical protein [Mesorhizobium sp. M1D.F.Ca.ET.043.01.1.1]AZO69953.1 hypothetical protein EJ067_01205 [Mesorhizobium sp. M1D.F.Ca.ET.043.01.1.1]